MAPQALVLSDLPPAEQDKMLNFLVEHKVNFTFNPATQLYFAHVQILPPSHGEAGMTPRTSVRMRIGGTVGSQAFKPAQRSKRLSQVDRSEPVPAGPPPKLRALQERLKQRYPHFCGVLPPCNEPPKELTHGELGKFMEEVYAHRYTLDATRMKLEAEVAAATGEQTSRLARAALRNGGTAEGFPRTTADCAKQRWGVSKVVGQHCWSVAAAVDRLRGSSDAVELFARFLEESYDAVDLMFFLNARDEARQALLEVHQGGPTWGTIGKGLQHKVLGIPPAQGAQLRKRPVPSLRGEAGQHIGPSEAIRVVRAAVVGDHLQEQLLAHLNEVMRQQMADSADGRGDISVHLFLKIVTDEYHNVRTQADAGGHGADEDAEAQHPDDGWHSDSPGPLATARGFSSKNSGLSHTGGRRSGDSQQHGGGRHRESPPGSPGSAHRELGGPPSGKPDRGHGRHGGGERGSGASHNSLSTAGGARPRSPFRAAARSGQHGRDHHQHHHDHGRDSVGEARDGDGEGYGEGDGEGEVGEEEEGMQPPPDEEFLGDEPQEEGDGQLEGGEFEDREEQLGLDEEAPEEGDNPDFNALGAF